MRTTCVLASLLVAILVGPLFVSAESDTDRAKREVDAFCKTVPLYCSKLSKKEKQAMLKRFTAESPHATPLHMSEPNRDPVDRDREGWPIPRTVGELAATSCAKSLKLNPYGQHTDKEVALVVQCTNTILQGR